MVSNIVFDFGGVLVSYDFETWFVHQLGSREKAEWFMTHVFTPEDNSLLDKADKPFGAYMAEWKQKWPDYAHVFDTLDAHYTDIFTGEVPGMKELMRTLKAKGYRLLGLSNWSEKVNDVIGKFPDIFSLLDGSLVSYQVHQLKPGKAIYETFCKKFSTRPEECVFIDDKPANIEGAQSIGMKGIVFKDTAQLRHELHPQLRP